MRVRPRILFPLAVVALAAVTLWAFVAPEQKVLYEKESPYNNIVVTEDEDGLRHEDQAHHEDQKDEYFSDEVHRTAP